jgi:glycine C-acetyltransferase
VYDVDAHACIIDGVRLHMGKRFTYRHNDLEYGKKLERATKLAEVTGGGFFITEGVLECAVSKVKKDCCDEAKFNFRFG